MAGKKYRAFAEKLEDRAYALNEAIPILQQNKISKFDETVEVHLNLGVDPRHADQMVRGTVVLPHGLGVSKRVLVIASGEKLREAEEAGADFFGGEEYVEKIQKDRSPSSTSPPTTPASSASPPAPRPTTRPATSRSPPGSGSA